MKIKSNRLELHYDVLPFGPGGNHKLGRGEAKNIAAKGRQHNDCNSEFAPATAGCCRKMKSTTRKLEERATFSL